VPGGASRLLCKALVKWLLSPDRVATEAWLDRASVLIDEEITKLLTLPTFVGLLARLASLPCTPKRSDAGLRFFVAWLHVHPTPTTFDETIERHVRQLLLGSR
jgi:hypothetical protein